MAPSAESDGFTCRIVDRLLSVNDERNPSLTNCVKAEEIVELLQRCTKVLLSQPVLLGVSPEIFICGDIHGQFTDLLRIFNRCQFPPTTSYLFLGDYVDRGSQQLEVICLLMCYKILYQGSFFLLRGNHECTSINKVYGFYEECKRRYNVQLYNAFQDLFNSLPLAAIVAERIFCCHGGISPKILSFEQINHIQRPFDPPNGSFVIDLLWSDPDESCKTWGKNSRGVSVVFGVEAVRQFCQQFSIDLIVRGHQVVEDGFEFFANRKLVTVFSAPKYCGEFDNAGGIMHVNEDLTCSFQILKPILHQIRTNAPYKKKGSGKRKKIRTDKTQTVD